MKKLTAVSLAAFAAFVSTPPASAQDVAGVFGKGRTHFAVLGGTGYAFDENYFVLGVGVSYYLFDGLNVGLMVESWSGGDPSMYKVTPSVQYVFHQVPTVKPYVGVFYRRTYIDGLSDISSMGGRAGAYFEVGRNAFFGAGVVYEFYVDCDKAVYRSCSDTYPELSITIAF